MNRYLSFFFSIVLCLLLSVLSTSTLQAQTNPLAKLTKESIVRDSTGAIMPFYLWSVYMRSGKYSARPNDDNTEFVLYELSETELENRKNARKPRESTSFKTGESFRIFNEKDMEGNKFNMDNLKGKILVINFWFIDCPPCKMEIPELNELVDSFGERKDVVFLAVARDKKWELEDFLKNTPFKYHIISEGIFWCDNYHIKSYPTHVVIDKEGKVYFHTMGLSKTTIYWLQKSIKELLATN